MKRTVTITLEIDPIEYLKNIDLNKRLVHNLYESETEEDVINIVLNELAESGALDNIIKTLLLDHNQPPPDFSYPPTKEKLSRPCLTIQCGTTSKKY